MFVGTAVAKIADTLITALLYRRNKARKENCMEVENQAEATSCEEPRILEEIQVEELAIDGICGVY